MTRLANIVGIPLLTVVCAYALWNGAVVPALDGIDTIAEQPTPKCCRICND